MAHIRDTHSHTINFQITCGLYGCPIEDFPNFLPTIYDLHGGDPLVENVKERSTTQQATAMEVEDVGEPETVLDDRQCEITNAKHTLYTIIPTQFQLHKRIAAQAQCPLKLYFTDLQPQFKERHRLTQRATQGILEGVTDLMI